MLSTLVVCSEEILSPGVSYQWQRSSNNTDWADIAGANASTYTLVSADANNYLRVIVTSDETNLAAGSVISDATVKITFPPPTSSNPTSSNTSSNPPPILYGDADQNGKVNVQDAIAILKHVTGAQPLTGQALAAADVDGKNGVNVQDAILILKKVTGIITVFPVEQ